MTSFFAVTWNFDVAGGDLGFNLMYPPYVPVEYTYSTHRRYTKGDLLYYMTNTFSCLECLNFDPSWVCYFSCFSITMAAPWLTVHFCRQSMDYHMVVYMSGHKIRKMCNPRPITLHEIHMSPSLFRNLLTQGFSYRPLKWQTDGDSRSPSVNDRTMDPGSVE